MSTNTHTQAVRRFLSYSTDYNGERYAARLKTGQVAIMYALAALQDIKGPAGWISSGDLAEATGMHRSTVNAHLRRLSTLGMVGAEYAGREAGYRHTVGVA